MQRDAPQSKEMRHKMRLAIGLAAAAVMAVAVGGHAAAQPAPRDQIEPDVLYDSDRDQFLLVWVEDAGAGNRIMASRVHGNGLPVGGPTGGWELTGATGTDAFAGQKGDQRNPVVVPGLVVWSEMAPGAADYDIYAQRLQANFRAYGQPAVIAGGPGNQRRPDVVANARSGEWLVVWDEDTNDAGDVLGVRISAALTLRSNVIEIAKGPGVAEDPTIARDLFDTSTFLVVFTDDRNGNKDLFGTRVTESGLPRGGPLGGAFEIVTSPEDDYAPSLVVNSGRSSSGDRRTVGPNSRNILLWTRDDPTDGPDVMVQRLSSNGLPLGPSFVLAGGSDEQSLPAGDLRNLDSFLVVWQGTSMGNLDIFGVELGLNGIVRRQPRVLAGD